MFAVSLSSRGAVRDTDTGYRGYSRRYVLGTGEKGERDLESHRKYKTYLLSFALVTCEDYVRTTRNSYNIQPTTNREGEAYGHTDIRPTFARMSYIRPRSFLPVSRIHTTYGKYGQILPVCRIYGQQRFWSINRMHTGNRITSLPVATPPLCNTTTQQ